VSVLVLSERPRSTHLTCGEIAERPREAVEPVGKHLELAAPFELGNVALEFQRDRLSELWKERFVFESRNLAYLDDNLGRIRPTLRRWRAWAPVTSPPGRTSVIVALCTWSRLD